MGPALFVMELYSPNAPPTVGPRGGPLLAVLERRNGDEVLAYYGVWAPPPS